MFALSIFEFPFACQIVKPKRQESLWDRSRREKGIKQMQMSCIR